MTLRDRPCFKMLGEELREFCRGRKIVEIVNTGNWGDSLIHAGQREFLKDYGIAPIRITASRLNKRGRAFRFILSRLIASRAIITGSGSLWEFYERPKEFAIAASNFSKVLIMPSSYPSVPAFDPFRTIFWRRDERESADVMPGAQFCHDLAFYLNPKPRQATIPVGFLFRNDIESSDFPLPAGNLDLSNEGTHKSDHEVFLDRIGAYEVIHTNRLHVGIGAALLGREVHLYGSRTKKIRSIFETSLLPNYKNVYFHYDPPAFDKLVQG